MVLPVDSFSSYSGLIFSEEVIHHATGLESSFTGERNY